MVTRVISLKASTARRKVFDKRMRNKILFEYVEAFSPTEIEDFIAYFAKSDIYHFADDFNPMAVIACAKSHYHLWLMSIHLGQELLVLEDDANFFDQNSFEKYKLLKFPSDYDVFFLEGDMISEEFKIIKPRGFHRGCAYVISVKGALKLVAEIDKNGFKRAVDWQIIDMQNIGLIEYALTIPIFRHDAKDSNIARAFH